MEVTHPSTSRGQHCLGLTESGQLGYPDQGYNPPYNRIFHVVNALEGNWKKRRRFLQISMYSAGVGMSSFSSCCCREQRGGCVETSTAVGAGKAVQTLALRNGKVQGQRGHIGNLGGFLGYRPWKDARVPLYSPPAATNQANKLSGSRCGTDMLLCNWQFPLAGKSWAQSALPSSATQWLWTAHKGGRPCSVVDSSLMGNCQT